MLSCAEYLALVDRISAAHLRNMGGAREEEQLHPAVTGRYLAVGVEPFDDFTRLPDNRACRIAATVEVNSYKVQTGPNRAEYDAYSVVSLLAPPTFGLSACAPIIGAARAVRVAPGDWARACLCASLRPTLPSVAHC